ncbi:hypothetical protein [Aliiroseovarius subalbicans]|uniref:hypothetical protein n=1 Tax=Aliiroseovarius subalbicans TaxID=2925840 RepID=UPI001F58746B|nr:hypothetical protein [Aliiroseovarius subalbicans]MCI2397843.1 hypothetical protein [Aliiroseovarius subalbicans]
MLAEALGQECQTVGLGWNLWDLQIGKATASFPERIRIQVKNSAKTQPWNTRTQRLSETSFKLDWRKKPDYFDRDFPNVQCETEGFMCDLFILCHHAEEDFTTSDHRDPTQWEFYLLPTRGVHSAITPAELDSLRRAIATGANRSSTIRRPTTLNRGIRGRPAIEALSISELSLNLIRASF